MQHSARGSESTAPRSGVDTISETPRTSSASFSMDITAQDFSGIVENDGFGVKGFLSMRDEGVTYHRMKRYYCRCVGLNFFRFASKEASHQVFNAMYVSEIEKLEKWDGRGLLHTYRNAFKIHFTNGVAFNADADSEEDKVKWIEYIENALKGAKLATQEWKSKETQHPDILSLSVGGLGFLDKKRAIAPKFKHLNTCAHPGCIVCFDSKRQHHCRNCGGSFCSEHSARFAILKHFQMLRPVRLCTGCFRVQRFIIVLSTYVQRYMTALIEKPSPPQLSAEDVEEVQQLENVLNDSYIGISDVIQELHLRRNGCNQAYAVVIAKLMELSLANVGDFEFFLPQIFHLWLTIDWIENNTKSAMLFRVINYAARLHIRLAMSLYWLARAAIDDSCGWGFGQSPLLVPDYLFRKFSVCKLLLINLEMQIQGSSWEFTTDKDLPASEAHLAIIHTLFNRLKVLLNDINTNNNSLGTICDVVTTICVPPQFLSLYPAYERFTPENSNEKQIFIEQTRFVQKLCEMTERLRLLPPPERKAALKKELAILDLPGGTFSPIGSCEDPIKKFLAIARDEGTVFTTKARAPTLVFFEVECVESLSGETDNAWLQRTIGPSFLSPTARKKSTSLDMDKSSKEMSESTTSVDFLTPSSGMEMVSSKEIAKALAMSMRDSADDCNLDIHEDAFSAVDSAHQTRDKNGIELSAEVEEFENEKIKIEEAIEESSFYTTREDEDEEEGIEDEKRDQLQVLPSSGGKPGSLGRTASSMRVNRRHCDSIKNIIAACETSSEVSAGGIDQKENGLPTSEKGYPNDEKSLLKNVLLARVRSNSNTTKQPRSMKKPKPRSLSNTNASLIPKSVEKYTSDQLFSIASNMERNFRETAGGTGNAIVFSGNSMVQWMIQNEIVRDAHHAAWLGSELLASGAIIMTVPPPTEEKSSHLSKATAFLHVNSSNNTQDVTSNLTEFEVSDRTIYRVQQQGAPDSTNASISNSSGTANVNTQIESNSKPLSLSAAASSTIKSITSRLDLNSSLLDSSSRHSSSSALISSNNRGKTSSVLRRTQSSSFSPPQKSNGSSTTNHIASRLISPRQKKEIDNSSLASAVSASLSGFTSPKSTANGGDSSKYNKSTMSAGSSFVGGGGGSTSYSMNGDDLEMESDRQSVISSITPTASTIYEKFEPENAIHAMKKIEQAFEKYIFPLKKNLENFEQLEKNLFFLKEQIEIVCDFIGDDRKRRQNAFICAFGESFEEKKERLRKESAFFNELIAKKQKQNSIPKKTNETNENEWDCVALIVKSNDDLRQEVLCLQLIRQFQDIFQSAELPLRLLPYGIIATSASTGMIEYIKNATSLDGLKKRKGFTTLGAHFVKTYNGFGSIAYKKAMGNFVKSMAAYSLVCYFLQIKDRHNGNIMIDSEGHVVHIDFGFILGIAPGGRFSLETAPFKLTSEMVEAMGDVESEYFKAFVILLIQGFLALQQHADTILMMIAIMAQESSCPCFLNQNPRDILNNTNRLFRRELNQNQVIKHVLRLVRRSHNSLRTRQYDKFQKMTNGILP